MEVKKCRDINNKLRGCLNYISTTTFSLDDFNALFKALIDHGIMDGKGTVDVKLINGLLMRRNTKTAAYLMNTPEDLKKHFDFYEFLYAFNPVSLAFA